MAVRIICATGHRPEKLGGYDERIADTLMRVAREALEARKPDQVISGMALGWDTAVARAAAAMGLPFVAAVPFVGQEAHWGPQDVVRYQLLLSLAHQVVVVTPGAYAPEKLQLRNEWMVNHSDKVLALFNGTPGGTANCIRYAKMKYVPVENVWDRFVDLVQLV